ncbi:hypothetical protein [Ensifer sp. ENS11]|nr:hypothetical protein [Ensifer sp. ENS11]
MISKTFRTYRSDTIIVDGSAHAQLEEVRDNYFAIRADQNGSNET